MINVDQTVSIDTKDQTIKVILDELLKGTDIKYSVVNRQIILSNLEGISGLTAQQQKSISGKVTDSTGGSLPGVTVLVKGTTTGVITDMDGKYTITKVPQNATLQFSFVGMKTQEIPAEGKTTINVEMMEESIMIEEAIAVGYGTVKKSDITGSVASVSSDELSPISSSNAIAGLQGKAAGVNIYNTSGEPGSGLKVRIRGVGTINNSEPIYVVDGFITSNIAYLNSSDINSVEVLKDASATAIYGSRGANGVVIITTKKGQEGKTKISFEAYYGVQDLEHTIPMANAWEFATLYDEAVKNGGAFLNSEERAVLDYVKEKKFVGTNWQEEVMQVAPVQNYELKASGGKGKNNYLLSANYYNQEGLVKNSGFEKFSLRFNNHYQLTDHIDFTSDISYMNSFKNNTNQGGILQNAIRMDPITAAWDENTNFYGSKFIESTGGLSNPALHADRQKVNGLNWDHRVVGNFSILLKDLFVQGLNFDGRFAGDLNFGHNKGYNGVYFLNATDQVLESSLYDNRSQNVSLMSSGYFTYNKKVGANEFNVMVGMEYQDFKGESLAGSAFDIVNDFNLYYLDLSRRPDGDMAGSNAWEARMLSYFTRVNYKLLDKYMLTATFRADGSSKMLSDNRWGYFPSFSTAWDVKKESFLESVDLISSMKVRAGWGIVGNEGSLSSLYAYANLIDSKNYAYNFGNILVNGSYPRVMANPDIKWESTTTSNIGLDLSLLDNRLSFVTDAFIRTTDDMILVPPIAEYVGADPTYANVGSVQNRGLELTVGWKNSKGDFNYDINWNISFVKNEVTSIGTANPITSGGLFWSDAVSRTEKGYPIGYFYGWKTDGLFNTQEELASYVNYEGKPIQPLAKPGDLKYVDQLTVDSDGDGIFDTTDGKINAADKVYIGSPFPDFTSGLNISLGYKNFDLSLYGFISYGNEIVNGGYPLLYGSDAKDNFAKSLMGRWTPENPDSNIPRMTSTDPNKNGTTTSDLFVEDGTYFRMKNIQVGYTLPSSISEKIHLNKLRVYVSSDNLFTLTRYRGWDPETARYGSGSEISAGVDSWNYPLARTIRGGLSIYF